MRLENLRRAVGTVRAVSAISGPSDTPKGHCRDQHAVLRDQYDDRGRQKPMGGGRLETTTPGPDDVMPWRGSNPKRASSSS
jgi:hypothetical protein